MYVVKHKISTAFLDSKGRRVDEPVIYQTHAGAVAAIVRRAAKDGEGSIEDTPRMWHVHRATVISDPQYKYSPL